MSLAASPARRSCMRRSKPCTIRSIIGVTLIETVLSLVILGGAMAALMTTVASSRTTQITAVQRQVGLVLAEDLMAEILDHSQYEEDDAIGLDSGENNGNRSLFDDIDDYDGWVQTPPTDRDGNSIAGAEGYTREVSVQWVQSLNPNATQSWDGGLKRIMVTVKRGEQIVAELISVRSDHWVAPEENY